MSDSDTTTPAHTTPADGEHTTNGMPHGSTSLTPHLVVSPAKDALDFYRNVFGASVLDVTRFPNEPDKLAHAVLDFGVGRMTLSDPIPDIGLIALDSSAGHPFSFALYTPDVDGMTTAAAEHGATVREQPATFVTGDRFASILDPFGVRWTIMTRVEDLSDEEGAARVAEWAAAQG